MERVHQWWCQLFLRMCQIQASPRLVQPKHCYSYTCTLAGTVPTSKASSLSLSNAFFPVITSNATYSGTPLNGHP